MQARGGVMRRVTTPGCTKALLTLRGGIFDANDALRRRCLQSRVVQKKLG